MELTKRDHKDKAANMDHIIICHKNGKRTTACTHGTRKPVMPSTGGRQLGYMKDNASGAFDPLWRLLLLTSAAMACGPPAAFGHTKKCENKMAVGERKKKDKLLVAASAI